MFYLFVGQDSASKDIRLEKLKQEFLSPESKAFNFDCLYARELTLPQLQEALLRLPAGAKRRVILVREAERLKENIKEFLSRRLKEPLGHAVLILDVNKTQGNDVFLRRILPFVKLVRFQEKEALNTFRLSQEIEGRRAAVGLKVLNSLLADGEKPERIIGGLRYSWQKGYLPDEERSRRLRLLLRCDLDIKTGRLKPVFALERLIIGLCCFSF